jgi:ribosome-binding protein aMBF1 (putative translation factor)
MKNSITVNELWKNVENSVDNKENVAISTMISDLISQMVIVRNKKNLTQRQLAEITGIKQSVIEKIEKLQEIPRIDTLAKIYYHLGISLTMEEKV